MADEFTFAEMLAQADIPRGQDGHGAAAVGHAVVQLGLFRDAPPGQQAVAAEGFVQPGHGGIPQRPLLVAVLLRHGLVAVEQVVGVDCQALLALEAPGKLLGQIQQILGVVQVHIQPDADRNAGLQQMSDIRQDDLVGAALPVDVGLHTVVDGLRAVQRDLDLLHLPVLHGLFYGFGVEEIAVGDHAGRKFDALLPEPCADDVDDLRIEQGLAAEPGELDFFAAAVVFDEPHHLPGSPGAHGRAGAALFEAVKTPGVAVHGGENCVAGKVPGLFLPIRQNPPHQIRILLLPRPLRHGEPVGFQIFVGKTGLPLFLGE